MQVVGMMKFVAVCVIVLLIPAGCTRFEAKPLSLERTAAQFEARTLDDPNLKAFLDANLQRGPATWPLQEWDFEPLTLVAFYYHPSLDVVRAQWAVAQAGVRTAGERPNPTVDVTPGFNSTTGYGASISPWIVTAALNLPVETAGKRGYRMAQAQYLSEAARLQIAQAAWLLRHQVREAMLDLYAANETEVLLREGLRLREDNVKLLEQMLELGAITANELGQARILRDQIQLASLDAGKQRVQARMRLAAAIGVPARALESIRLSFKAFEVLREEIPPMEAQRRALLHREDLLAALAEYQASQSALQLEIARQYPDVQLGPGYEFDQSENKWTVGLSLTLPVFNQNQGAIATAEAHRAEAAAKFRALQTEIIGNIEQAVASYRAALTKIKTAEALAAEFRTTVDRTRKMYEAGEVVALDVTAAELEQNTNAVNQLDARVEALRSLGQLEDAMHVALDSGSLAATDFREHTANTGIDHYE
jgi:cobalt-zinc-cadmium efflux system outer membrane protein